jgi:hypothetical protein
MYCIVQFSQSKKPMADIIHEGWFVDEEEEKCYWPQKGEGKKWKESDISKMAEKGVKPDKTWGTFDVAVLGRAGGNIIIFINDGKIQAFLDVCMIMHASKIDNVLFFFQATWERAREKLAKWTQGRDDIDTTDAELPEGPKRR